MKNFTLVFAIVLTGFFSACDEVPEIAVLSSPPVVEIDDPGAIIAGVSADLTANLSDGSVSPLSSAILSILSGETELSTTTVTVSGQSAMVTYTSAESGITSLDPGDYTFKVVAKDVDGNSTEATLDFTIGDGPPSIGIIGDATPGGWDMDTDLTFDPNVPTMYSISITLTDGEAKFRQDDDWAVNWGAVDFPTGTGTQDGANIPVAAGTYTVNFNISTGVYSFE